VRAQRDPEGGTAVELADAFCAQATVRVEELFTRLWSNSDTSDRAVARHVLDDRFTWLENGVLDPSIDGPWIAPAPPGPSTQDTVHRRIG
ncbi:MAG: acyl-CoA dehydrogenase family protein, partial [Pseudonocardiaceae bacterium]